MQISFTKFPGISITLIALLSTAALPGQVTSPPVDDRTKELYDGFHSNRNLRDEAATATKDLSMLVGPGHEHPLGETRAQTAASPDLAVLDNKTCAADLVVLGRVNAATSYFSEDGRSIFSVYGISVEKIFRQSGRRYLTEKSTLFISRLGGTVRVNDHSISLIESGVDLIQNGQGYLFFLRAVTGSDIYQAFSQSILDTRSGVSVFTISNRRKLDATLEQVAAEVASVSASCPSLPPSGGLQY